MATLTGKQLKDSYQGLLTIKTADDANPLSGRLENGLGNAITALGIGTDSPSYPLTVKVDSATGIKVLHGNDSSVFQVDSFGSTGTDAGALLRMYNEAGDATVQIDTRSGGTRHTYFNNGGNLGIGTNSTSAKLTLNDAGQQVGIDFKENGTTRAHIEYDGSLPAFKVGSNGSAYLSLRTNNDEKLRIEADGDIAFYDDANNQGLFWDASTARLGIGETSPASPLSVEFSDSGTTQASFKGLILANSSSTTNNGAVIAFPYGGSSSNSFSRIGAIHTNRSGGSESTDLFFGTIHNGSYAERMRIDSSGTLQVRNQTPTIQLYNTDTSLGNEQTLGDLDWYQNDPSGSGVNVVAKIRGVNESSFQGQGALAFHVGASGSVSEKMRILSSGGITFNGDTASANALDDYEEGTFTPTLGGTWTTDPTSLTGKYTKIGNVVHVQITFSGGAKASATSGYLEDLPFTASHGTGQVMDSSVNDKGGVLFANTDRIWFAQNSFAVGTNRVTGTYLIN
jgi:hypothetical protein